MWLIKVDQEGHKLWEQIIQSAKYDGSPHIAASSDGGCMIVGTIWNDHTDSWDMWLFELDQEGSCRHWEQKYGGRGDDNGSHVLLLKGGAVVVTGSTTSQGEGGSDLWILKFSLGK